MLMKALDVFLSCHTELESMVTHRLPIQEAEKAFILYEQHTDGILKVLLDMSGW